jgi:hypothetical protein
MLPAKKSKRSNRGKRRCASMLSQMDIDNELDYASSKPTSKAHALRNAIDAQQNPRRQ